MGRIIGIDLGTTNSLAAYWDGEKSVLIPNRFGGYLTPSVVCVDEDGTISVGDLAKERQITEPELCASSFKRGMGTEKRYILGNRIFSAEELSALVLKSLKEDAETFLGETIDEAVVSVPAYFGDKARRATRKAGRLAGLRVDRIVNEPSAAALSFRQLHKETEGNILVFDFGGGTLDVSLVDCFENVVEIIAVSGDNQLGGLDFDQQLAKSFCANNGILFESLGLREQEQILRDAERVKRMLTIADKVEMKVNTETISANWTITQKDLVILSARVLERINKPVRHVLQDGRVSIGNLAGVVLVGGTCKMPVVQNYVRYLLRNKEVDTFHPDVVVAMGTAIYAGIKEKRGDDESFILTDICPFSLGTNILNKANVDNELMSVIIPRNSALPASRENIYGTAGNNQTVVKIGIYQGEDLYAKNNIKLDEIIINGIPPRPAGEEKVALRYSYDINGILLVDAKVLSSGEERHLILGNEEENEETQRQIAMLQRLRSDPRETEENKLLMKRAERVYQQLTDTSARESLAAQISLFDTRDSILIRKEGARLRELLEKLEQEYFAEYMLRDDYMDDFLKWYEEQQDEFDAQGWKPK